MSARTQSAYRQTLHSLVDFCHEHQLDWSNHPDLDLILVVMFGVLFDEGFGVGVGRKICSAVGLYLQMIPTDDLTGAVWALHGWRNFWQPMQRLPMPEFLIFVIAVQLAEKHLPQMSVWVLLTYSANLRSSETMKLIGKNLIAKILGLSKDWGLIINDAYRGLSGKTGMSDESMMITDRRLHPVMEALKMSCTDNAPLWNFNLGNLAEGVPAYLRAPATWSAGRPSLLLASQRSMPRPAYQRSQLGGSSETRPVAVPQEPQKIRQGDTKLVRGSQTEPSAGGLRSPG